MEVLNVDEIEVLREGDSLGLGLRSEIQLQLIIGKDRRIAFDSLWLHESNEGRKEVEVEEEEKEEREESKGVGGKEGGEGGGKWRRRRREW